MKKGEAFQMDSSWWLKEGAKTLSKSGLGEALKSFEGTKKKFSAVSKQSSAGTEFLQAYLNLKEAIEAVDAARLKTIAACKELIHKETKEALLKHSTLIREKEYAEHSAQAYFEEYVKKGESAFENQKKGFETMLVAVEKGAAAKQNGNDDLAGKCEKVFLTANSSAMAAYQLVIMNIKASLPPSGVLKRDFPELGSRAEAVQKSYLKFKPDELVGQFTEAFGHKPALKEAS